MTSRSGAVAQGVGEEAEGGEDVDVEEREEAGSVVGVVERGRDRVDNDIGEVGGKDKKFLAHVVRYELVLYGRVRAE